MDFELSQEQAMLKDSVERFIQDHYAFSARKALAETAQGYSDDNWATFAEMGWLALPISEDHGGLGGSPVDVAVVMEALGAGLTLEPFVPSVLLGAAMVEAAGSEAQKAALLPEVAEGRMKLALACNEPNARHSLTHVEMLATAEGDGWKLSGQKSVVHHAVSADHIVVIARVAAAASDADGLSAFLVEAEAPGLRRQDYALVDGTRASDLFLADVPAELLGQSGEVGPALQVVIDRATSAICAEAVGAMRAVLEITKDYTQTRKQFGKAIGDNQVIQHRLVDMFTAVEEAKALTDMVVMRLDDGAADAAMRVAALKAKVGECARFVGAQGVQLHGGIGMTDEYPIGHYFKRLMAIDVMFGDAAHHLNRFAEAI